MVALQLSSRGGKLFCQNLGERVLISGEAVTYLEGYISVREFSSVEVLPQNHTEIIEIKGRL